MVTKPTSAAATEPTSTDDFDGLHHEKAEAAVWVDLIAPDQNKLSAIQAQLGFEIPTQSELRHAPLSRRVFEKHGAHVMSCKMILCSGKKEPDFGELLLVMTNSTLVTVRYSGLSAFRLLEGQPSSPNFAGGAPEPIAVSLIEAIVAREADFIHRLEDHMDVLSRQVFGAQGKEVQRERRHGVAIKDIGRQSRAISRAHEALTSQVQLLTYMEQVVSDLGQRELAERVARCTRDVQSLLNCVEQLNGRCGFLMDATMGLIGIEQNQIMKVFTIATSAFMPPCLIAGIYGMNFIDMPELHIPAAYPITILAMVVTALTPIAYFKRKGWI